MHYLVTADGLGKGIVVIHTYLRARKKDNDVMDMKLSNYKRNLNLLLNSFLDFKLSIYNLFFIRLFEISRSILRTFCNSRLSSL